MNKQLFTKIVCPVCGKLSSAINYWRHEKWHLDHPTVDYNHQHACIDHDGLNCKYCGKLCKNKNSLAQHEIRCKENKNRLPSTRPKGVCTIPYEKKGYGKGMTKYQDERRMRNALSIKKHYENHCGAFTGRKHSEETKEKIRQKQLNVDHQYHDRYLWSKKGYYDNVFFMSTYELAYYIYMRDSGHMVRRCDCRYKYIYNDKEHYYTPDFILDEQSIIEIKGKESNIDLIKYKSVPNLKVLYYKDIKHMIYYVIKKYDIKKIKDLYD